ncbi:MlaD family protein [Paramagnetospirillum magneticum]|uniref:ABC-type transport system involved in resistance to organic solvents, periplasmic component n=1 Tax=Paramagnetospirillum magneticum (strain ATCC 700264 / AMB-1) TaxID=342108 RepID=Q2W3M8_PARM1|nr:MlaD family protein [Paramagnetospirillum magneticum]BAE51547.1 ABC-type transport system involved in resistance to organic solvents, periplasmic component [Paramagnetospirillum magneticum AMB-1]
MGRNLIETIMGAVVLAVAGFFLVFAYTHANLKKIEGYEITGTFASVGGLDTGADVKINGIKVGTVAAQTLDPVTYDAVVKLSIAHGISLPSDTVASVSSEGLLGGKFIKLTPGKSTSMIAAGGALGPSKNFKSIEEMVGQLIFLATTDNQPSAPPSPAAPRD